MTKLSDLNGYLTKILSVSFYYERDDNGAKRYMRDLDK